MDTQLMKCPTFCNYWSVRNENGQVVNFDEAAGIHYGVIHQNDLMAEAVDDIQLRGTDVGYLEAEAALRATLRSALTPFHQRFAGRSMAARQLLIPIGELVQFNQYQALRR